MAQFAVIKEFVCKGTTVFVGQVFHVEGDWHSGIEYTDAALELPIPDYYKDESTKYYYDYENYYKKVST